MNFFLKFELTNSKSSRRRLPHSETENQVPADDTNSLPTCEAEVDEDLLGWVFR